LLKIFENLINTVKHIPSWIPGAGFKHIAQAWREQLLGIADRPYAFVKSQMDSGKYKPSYLSNIFNTHGVPEPGSEREIVAKWTAASLYTGGADTVSFKEYPPFQCSDTDKTRLCHRWNVFSSLWPYILRFNAKRKMRLREFWDPAAYQK